MIDQKRLEMLASASVDVTNKMPIEGSIVAPSKDDEEEPSKEQSNQTEDTDIEQGLVRKKEKGASKN